MKILTYNISWQSMTGNSGWKLCNSVKKGNPKYYGVCQSNIVKVIDKISFDIIALQEATNFADLILLSSNLKKMKYVVYKDGYEELVIFYKPEMKVIDYRVGSFEPSRPYQIISFEKFVFVNVHHGHYTETVMLSKMSKALEDFANSRIIIAGDFNNQVNKISNLKIANRKFYANPRSIKTCCYPVHSYQTDHIIDTKEIPVIKTVETGMASDHKPIIALINT